MRLATHTVAGSKGALPKPLNDNCNVLSSISPSQSLLALEPAPKRMVQIPSRLNEKIDVWRNLFSAALILCWIPEIERHQCFSTSVRYPNFPTSSSWYHEVSYIVPDAVISIWHSSTVAAYREDMALVTSLLRASSFFLRSSEEESSISS